MAAGVITDPGESVYNFKLRVAEAARHGYKISLKWNDTVLEPEDDSKKLSEYGIRCGDTVALTNIPFKLMIQGPAPLCEQYTLYVEFDTKVSSIKQEIATHHEYSTTNDIDLRWNDQTLLANKTVGYYGIKEDGLIIVAERIASRLGEVIKRKDSLDVEHDPFHSPPSQHKLVVNDDLDIVKSESMPDLSILSPDDQDHYLLQ